MPVEAVTAELLVRYLDSWIPGALHSSRRVTFVQCRPQTVDPAAAVRVFAEFADRMKGRRVSLIFVAPDVSALPDDLELPAELGVYPVAGAAATHLTAALSAAQAGGAPTLTYAETTEGLDQLATAVAAGKPPEILLLTEAGTHREVGETLRTTGFDLISSVELVADGEVRLLVFATRSAKSLEVFKDELWQLDEYAGVSIRDPHDPDAQLLDIALTPQPGPLRRQILAYLTENGERTVTEVRRFALTETVYRVSDATHVLTALVSGGALTRHPSGGRLAGDTVVRIA
jgi:hypothetical protein